MKNVILINGLPRAGKDTLADYLIQKYGFEKMSFADELKDIICRTLGISREDLDYYKNEKIELCVNNGGRYECIIDFRDLLRKFGTEGMKPTFGDSIWADILYNKIQKSNFNTIIVPDFRFLCEYQKRENLNIRTILVKDNRELPLIGHSSDIELYRSDFKFDYIIYNNKDETFFENIDKLAQEFKIERNSNF